MKFTTAQKIKSLQKGFTLIELIVVIAVLGILAAAVLTLINPLEQLERGRDASRISTIAQFGHLMSAYATANNALYPSVDGTTITNANWLTKTLVNSSDLTTIPAAPTNSGCNLGSANSSQQAGVTGPVAWCYTSSGAGVGNTSASAVIYTKVISKNNIVKACGTSTNAIADIVFGSSQGKSVLYCESTAGVATPPTAANVFNTLCAGVPVTNAPCYQNL